MPTYEFACPAGHLTTLWVSVDEFVGMDKVIDCGHVGCDQLAQLRIAPVPSHGRRKGPGAGSNQMCFARVDSLKEAELTAKKMEERGVFRRDPKMLSYVQTNIDALKNMPEKARTHDYDKAGHPLDGLNPPPKRKDS